MLCQHRLLAGGCSSQGKNEAALQAGSRWCHLTRRDTLEIEHKAMHQTGGNRHLASSTILLDPGSGFFPKRAATKNMCPSLIIASQLQTSCMPHHINNGISSVVTPKRS